MSRDSTTWGQTVADISPNETNLAVNMTQEPPLSEHTVWLRYIEPLVLLYSTVVLATLGITGNSFSLAVFVSSPNFRHSSTIQFLIALAITDSLYLIGDLFFTLGRPSWEPNYLTRINFVYSTDVGCKAVMWLRYR